MGLPRITSLHSSDKWPSSNEHHNDQREMRLRPELEDGELMEIDDNSSNQRLGKGKGKAVVLDDSGLEDEGHQAKTPRLRSFNDPSPSGPSPSRMNGSRTANNAPRFQRIQHTDKEPKRERAPTDSQFDRPVPLPSASRGTINSTLNLNGTVTSVAASSPAQSAQSSPVPDRTSLSKQQQQDQSPTQQSTLLGDSGQCRLPLSPDASSNGMVSSQSQIDHQNLMSPPTPAPSPTPGRKGWWGTVPRDGGDGKLNKFGEMGEMRPEEIQAIDPAQFLEAFPSLPPPTRLRFLEDLLPLLHTPELLMLSAQIVPRLKRDFLRDLPIELGLHVLSFVDDPITLARASLVSKHWYALMQDEKTWKNMCSRHRFQSKEVIVPLPSMADDLPPVSTYRPAPYTPIERMPSSTNNIDPGFPIPQPSSFVANRVSRGDERASNRDHTPSNATPQSSTFAWQNVEAGSRAYQSGHRPSQSQYRLQVQQQYQHQRQQQLREQYQQQPGHSPNPEQSNGSSSSSQYTGTTNGLLPPMPSIVSPMVASSIAAQGMHTMAGLGLNTRPAEGSSQQGFIRQRSSEMVSQPGSFAQRLQEMAAAAAATSIHSRLEAEGSAGENNYAHRMPTSTSLNSNLSGYGRSTSVPDPIVMSNKRDAESLEPGFSYKNHFKKSYLTGIHWLRGGKLLSTHTSNDDGVVATSVMNEEYIAIGMVNAKIHVFEAKKGKFLRTLVGHEAGVWTSVLVTTQLPDTSQSIDTEDEPSFNMGSIGQDPESRGKSTKSRRRARADTRRASFDDNGIRSGNQHSRPRRAGDPVLGSTDPNGPFGPRYPGVEMIGNKYRHTDTTNTARGWGQDRTLILSGGCDRIFRVWDIATGRCIHALAGHTSTIRCISLLPGRPVALTGSRDSTLRVWDIERGVLLHLLVGHSQPVRACAVAGHYGASASYDCTARIWNLETGQCLQVLRGHYHQLYDITFDGERVATGSLDSSVRIWSAATGECVALLQGHTSLVGQIRLRGDILVTAGSDGRVIIFNLATYTCLQRVCAHDNSVTCLQFDDRFIVSGGNDGRVKLWDVKTGNFIRELSRPSESVWRINFQDDKCAILCQRGGKTVMELITFNPDEVDLSD